MPKLKILCQDCNSELTKYEEWFGERLVEGKYCKNCGWGYTYGNR